MRHHSRFRKMGVALILTVVIMIVVAETGVAKSAGLTLPAVSSLLSGQAEPGSLPEQVPAQSVSQENRAGHPNGSLLAFNGDGSFQGNDQGFLPIAGFGWMTLFSLLTALGIVAYRHREDQRS